MKGLFFKNNRGEGYEIVSDVLCVRHTDGYDELIVVIKRLDSNQIALMNVMDIDVVASCKEHIGY